MKIIKFIYNVAIKIVPHQFIIETVVFAQKWIGFIKYGDFHFPRGFGIEITSHCNRRCFYCPQSVSPKPVREIEMSVYMRWIERLKELKWKGVVFFHFYNEPLLCKNLEKYVSIAKSELPGCMFNITSNGDLLTEERLISLVNAGVFKFTITHHPPYKEAWENRMAGLKAKYPSRIHYHSLKGRELSNRGGKVEANIANNSYSITSSAKTLSEKGCFTTSTGHTTSIDGDYIWCCCDYDKRNCMGNVNSTSILDSWNSKPWKSLRKNVQNGKPRLDVCKACFGLRSASAAESPRPHSIGERPAVLAEEALVA